MKTVTLSLSIPGIGQPTIVRYENVENIQFIHDCTLLDIVFIDENKHRMNVVVPLANLVYFVQNL